jgi:hypothetical protein
LSIAVKTSQKFEKITFYLFRNFVRNFAGAEATCSTISNISFMSAFGSFKPPPLVGIPRMGANRLRSAVIVLLNIFFSDNRNCAATLSLEESFCHITFRTLKVQNPFKRKKLPIVSLVQELYILLLQAIKHNNGADSKGIKKLTTLF